MRIVVLVAAAFAGLWTYLAVGRHEAFGTNAFDLGYVTQTLWSTAHGAPFHFTTLEGVPFRPEETLDPSRLHQPHSLLAFHVEPLLLLVAPIFAPWPDPRLLLALQALALALGGVSVAALARVRTSSEVVATVFGCAFLLSPSVAAAALSDFHAVALGAALLAAALLFLARGQRRYGVVLAFLAAASREDAAVVVATLGAYLGTRHLLARRRLVRLPPTALSVEQTPDPLDELGRDGLILLLGAGGWVLLAFLAIMPFFNGTLHALRLGESGVGSIFWHRYAWLGETPLLALRNLVADPGRWLGWLARSDVLAYLATLALSGGGLALLAPDVLTVGLPLVLQNALSSFEWMRSGGAHYSVILVPILALAGIEGYRRVVGGGWWALGRDGPRPFPLPNAGKGDVSPRGWGRDQSRAPNPGLLVLVLVAAVANHVWLGASPLVPGLTWPAPGPRERAVAAVLDEVPSDASVAATSAVYPHLASRARAYWFPALSEAEVVAVDVAASAHPLAPPALKAQVDGLLAQGDYGVAAVASGFLLLRRGASSSDLPPRFLDFARASPDELATATKGSTLRFGESLALDGYRLERSSTLTIFGPAATLTTYWHVDRPEPRPLAFTFFVTRPSDGAIVGELRDAAPEPLWDPPSRWPSGETIRLTLHLARARDVQAIGVAVIDQTTGRRLPIQPSAGSVFWEGGTIGRITRLDCPGLLGWLGEGCR